MNIQLDPSMNAFSSADYYYNVIIYYLSLGVVAPSHCVSPKNFMESGKHSPPGLLWVNKIEFLDLQR